MTTWAPILAWIPIIQPMPAAHRWWWLLIIPLAIGVSMSWKAVRLPTLENYWRHVTSLSVQIVFGVVGIAVGLYVLILIVLPYLPAD